MYDSWYEFKFEENLKEKCGNIYQIYDEDLINLYYYFESGSK